MVNYNRGDYLFKDFTNASQRNTQQGQLLLSGEKHFLSVIEDNVVVVAVVVVSGIYVASANDVDGLADVCHRVGIDSKHQQWAANPRLRC